MKLWRPFTRAVVFMMLGCCCCSCRQCCLVRGLHGAGGASWPGCLGGRAFWRGAGAAAASNPLMVVYLSLRGHFMAISSSSLVQLWPRFMNSISYYSIVAGPLKEELEKQNDVHLLKLSSRIRFLISNITLDWTNSVDIWQKKRTKNKNSPPFACRNQFKSILMKK